MNLLYQLQSVLISVPAVLIAISIHEFAHGYVSYKLGDPTPKLEGRLSLNPFHHLDLYGTLCLLVFHFGWARPVRINPAYYENKKKGSILVALAGPVSNFITAFVFLIFYRLIGLYGNEYLVTIWIKTVIYYSAIINVGLGVFNLIPIPPLDGSHVLRELVPGVNQFFYKIERYAPLILCALIFVGVLRTPLSNIQSSILNGMWSVIKTIIPAKAAVPVIPSTGGLI